MGVTLERIVELHPRLYHMAEQNSWPKIQKFGLLSTSAILDACGLDGAERKQIEECKRPGQVALQSEKLGTVVIRDQHPLSDKKLAGCLTDGLSTAEWHRLLNGRVFFWLTTERLVRLMKVYNQRPNLVLEMSTEALLRAHWKDIELCPMNSGTTSPMAFPRGRSTFQSPSQYDFELNAKKKGGHRKAIVELTVNYAVPDIGSFVISARHAAVRSNRLITTEWIYRREGAKPAHLEY